MSNSIYFVRHAESKVDMSKSARAWTITRAGINATKELAKEDIFSKIDGIVHSSEKKARRTAEILAKELNASVYELSELDELKRDYKESLSDEDYRNRVRLALTEWDKCAPSWESASSCLRRMLDGIRHINIMFFSNNIIAVSHGIAMTILFAHLKKLESIAFERWSRLSYLSWGLVREDRVLVDLI